MPMIQAESLKKAVVIAFFLLSFKEGAAADLVRGHSIAVRWCSECHVVAPGRATAPMPFRHSRRSRLQIALTKLS